MTDIRPSPEMLDAAAANRAAPLEERLPRPDWTREGETWRVEPEPYIAVEEGGVCGHRWRDESGRNQCWREGVAVIADRLPICERHLAEICRAWIEDGQVVSWRLSE